MLKSRQETNHREADTKIGVLGTRNVRGHLADPTQSEGHVARAADRGGPISLAEVADHLDVVILAVHDHLASDVLEPHVDLLRGKILVDATNPLNDGWFQLLLEQETSAANETAK